MPIFNEKVMAGLGAGLRDKGELSDASEDEALAALRRYKLLLRHMGVKQAQVVATAAVRDARDGPEFVRAVEKIGLERWLGAGADTLEDATAASATSRKAETPVSRRRRRTRRLPRR